MHRALPLIILLALSGAGCVDLALDLDSSITGDSFEQETGQTAVSAAEVRIEGNAFRPAVVTITVGGTVRWTNFDQTDHTVTEGLPESTSPAWDSGRFGAGGQYTHQFDSAGDVQYFCATHPQIMRDGVVHIVEAP